MRQKKDEMGITPILQENTFMSMWYLIVYTMYIKRSVLKKISDVVTLGLFVIGTSHLLIGGGRLFFSRKEKY